MGVEVLTINCCEECIFYEQDTDYSKNIWFVCSHPNIGNEYYIHNDREIKPNCPLRKKPLILCVKDEEE